MILALLVAFSLASWAIMINKIIMYRKAVGHSERFLEVFRTSKRFSEVNAAAANYTASPLVGLFQAGYVEIDAQVKFHLLDQCVKAPADPTCIQAGSTVYDRRHQREKA